MAEDSHVPPLPRRARGDTPRLGPGPSAGPFVLPEPVVQQILSVLDAIRAEASPHYRPARAEWPAQDHPGPATRPASLPRRVPGTGTVREPPAPIANPVPSAWRAALAVGGSANSAAHGHRHSPGKGGHKTAHGRAGHRGAARACRRRASQRPGDPCSTGSGQTAAGSAFPHGRDTGQPAESAGQPEGKADAAGITCRPVRVGRRPVMRKR